MISVDTKKKELVGQFKNGGREWLPRGEPERVNVHDFMDKELGKAIPYGVYDVAADAGWVSAWAPTTTPPSSPWPPSRPGGARPDRPPTRDASRLLITADGGGSNGYRTRLWKTELAHLADETGLDHHRVPPAARHQQMEQDRAPAVLATSR